RWQLPFPGAREAIIIGDRTPAPDVIVTGGVVTTDLPDMSWAAAHHYGGGGVRLITNGPSTFANLRIHDIEDAIKPRERPGFSGIGSFVLRSSYFSCIRDDMVENDGFMPGSITDVLVDGAHTGLSEQNQSGGPLDCQTNPDGSVNPCALSDGEKDTIEI